MFTICCAFVACLVFATIIYATIKLPAITLQYRVTGIQNQLILKNVNDTLLNLRARVDIPLTKAKVQHFAKNAPHFIQDALQPYGYFHSTITSTLTKIKHGWLVQFAVIVGKPLPITSVQIEIQGAGKNDPVFHSWLATSPLRVGDPLNTITYDKVKNALNDIATQRGYFDAKMVKSQISINLVAYRAQIIIVFDTGMRYRFGETTFSKSIFHEKFLRRFLTYLRGTYYDAKQLEKTQEDLVNSNYFNQVLMQPKPTDAVNGYVPIHVALIPRHSKAYTLGFGYGSDTGIRGTLGLTLRNLGGEGHRFHALLRGSQDNSSFTTRYTIPGFNPAHDIFTIGAGASHINQSTGNADNAKFGLGYTVSRGHWKNSLTLNYLNERYNITILPKTSTELVYPTLDFKYLDMDRKMNPKRGFSFDTELSGANRKIITHTNFFQIVVHVKSLCTIDRTKTRLIFRSDLGHTSIANLVQLPLSMQLLAGGSHSVRGYGYNSIGPGRNLAVASSEVQQRLFGKFYAAAFVDAGVVGNQDIFHHINVGAGPGLAWITPVGTIELTVANAFTQSNKPWTIQFTMGSLL